MTGLARNRSLLERHWPWFLLALVFAATIFVLASLGAFAYPGRPFRTVGAGLAAFGVLIELVQALPFIHRDAEVLDVVADVIGIAAALVPLRLFGLPKYRRADEPGR